MEERTSSGADQQVRKYVEGTYKGKNLFIQNPLHSQGIFCITDARLNGHPIGAAIASSAFEIDFTNFHIQQGEQVLIELVHHNGCEPKVLNPEAIGADAG